MITTQEMFRLITMHDVELLAYVVLAGMCDHPLCIRSCKYLSITAPHRVSPVWQGTHIKLHKYKCMCMHACIHAHITCSRLNFVEIFKWRCYVYKLHIFYLSGFIIKLNSVRIIHCCMAVHTRIHFEIDTCKHTDMSTQSDQLSMLRSPFLMSHYSSPSYHSDHLQSLTL